MATPILPALPRPDVPEKPPKFRRYAPQEREAMLVEAGLACLARGGITAFTIDNICTEAKASRGLIAHHFGSKDGLLAAVYAAAYAPFLAAVSPPEGPEPDLGQLVEAAFSDALFARENLNVWLALWGEIAVNQGLKAAHRKLFDTYRASVAKAITVHAAAAGRSVDAEGLSLSFIALIDGYWLEQHIDPERLSQARARAAFLQMWEPILGKITLPGSGPGSGPGPGPGPGPGQA